MQFIFFFTLREAFRVKPRGLMLIFNEKFWDMVVYLVKEDFLKILPSYFRLMVIQKNFPVYQFEFFIQIFPVSPFIVMTEPFHLLFPFDFFSNAKSYGIMVRNAEPFCVNNFQIFQIASRCCE